MALTANCQPLFASALPDFHGGHVVPVQKTTGGQKATTKREREREKGRERGSAAGGGFLSAT